MERPEKTELDKFLGEKASVMSTYAEKIQELLAEMCREAIEAGIFVKGEMSRSEKIFAVISAVSWELRLLADSRTLAKVIDKALSLVDMKEDAGK
jgi:urease alpha subunit